MKDLPERPDDKPNPIISVTVNSRRTTIRATEGMLRAIDLICDLEECTRSDLASYIENNYRLRTSLSVDLRDFVFDYLVDEVVSLKAQLHLMERKVLDNAEGSEH